MNTFHKIVIVIAFLIVGVGVFKSLQESQTQKYQHLSDIATKYDLIGLESISSQNTTLAKSFAKTMTASVFNLNPNQSYHELIVKLDSSLPVPELFVLKFSDVHPVHKIQKELANSDLVHFAEKNYLIALEQQGSDSENKKLNLSLPTVLTSSDEDSDPVSQVKVGLIDSGVDLNHTDLADKKIYAKTFRGDLKDEVGHGTHLAGLIYQEAPNVELYSYKFTDGKVGKLGDLLKAIFEASNDKVDILNLSLGLPINTDSLKVAIEFAQKNGVLVVAAAGNQDSSNEFYPAALKNVISVAGLSDYGSKLTRSNYGKWVDYSIDGQELYSLAPNNSYRYLSGTSQSAAVITGKIASLMYNNAKVEQEDIYSYFLDRKLDVDDDYKNLLGIRVQL